MNWKLETAWQLGKLGFEIKSTERLLRYATSLQRLNEAACSYPYTPTEKKRDEIREARIVEQVRLIAKQHDKTVDLTTIHVVHRLFLWMVFTRFGYLVMALPLNSLISGSVGQFSPVSMHV